MYIFSSPSSIKKIITLLLVWGVASFAFAQEEAQQWRINRGYVEYREIPEVKKGTVIFPLHCERDVIPEPRRDRLSDLQRKARIYRSEGWRYQCAGDIDKALSFYKKAIALEPNYAVAYNDLGVIYEMKGQLDLAQEYYLKSVNIDPYYLSAYSNLALLHERKEQFDKAVFYWKRRLELGCTGDPWTEKARKHLQDIPLSSGGEVDTSDEQKILDLIEEALRHAENLEQR